MTHPLVTEIAEAYGISAEELQDAYIESHILTRVGAAVQELQVRIDLASNTLPLINFHKEITKPAPPYDPTNTHLVEDFFAKEISKQTSLNIPYRKDIIS